jgi:hypothetical protein
LRRKEIQTGAQDIEICMPLIIRDSAVGKKKQLSDTDPKRHLSILHVSHQASHAIGSLVVFLVALPLFGALESPFD